MGNMRTVEQLRIYRKQLYAARSRVAEAYSAPLSEEGRAEELDAAQKALAALIESFEGHAGEPRGFAEAEVQFEGRTA